MSAIGSPRALIGCREPGMWVAPTGRAIGIVFRGPPPAEGPLPGSPTSGTGQPGLQGTVRASGGRRGGQGAGRRDAGPGSRPCSVRAPRRASAPAGWAPQAQHRGEVAEVIEAQGAHALTSTQTRSRSSRAQAEPPRDPFVCAGVRHPRRVGVGVLGLPPRGWRSGARPQGDPSGRRGPVRQAQRGQGATSERLIARAASGIAPPGVGVDGG